MSEYRGLINEGSTCYLNSLLQTLFMTPEFRKNVYKYIHDEKKIKAVDSIPYQLQKLFVKLQLNQESCYTRGLLRSFQWNATESFTQHDVQQFCRILFEAIEKAHKGDNWIERLYSGTMESFISCGKHTRCTPELFMDLSLPIRDPYTNVYSQSIEECLHKYLKPEVLEDKILCDQCGDKVEVTKGTRFASLPQILTLQLNRFQLNYTTFQREKVNSFLYFPEILELDTFLKPYEQIELKGIPEDLKVKTIIKEKQKSSRSTNYWPDISVKGEGIKKRKNSDEIEAKKEKITFFDEQNKEKRTEITRDLSAAEEKMKNMQILQELKAEKGNIDSRMKKLAGKEEPAKDKGDKGDKKEKLELSQENKVQKAAESLEDDMLFGSFMSDVPLNFNSGSFERGDTVGEGSTPTTGGPTFEKTAAQFQHDQEGFDPSKDYAENTYILYSILVHSGGAYGGHYYAYIFDGQQWYRFDDKQVTKAKKSEIRKYGNPTQSANYGANAYLLFYRKASSFKQKLEPIEIPQFLLQKVKKDVSIEPVPEQKQFSRLEDINSSLIIKLFLNAQVQESFVVNRVEETVSSLRQRAKALFGIQEDDKNWRLRRYNKSDDTMHEGYGESLYETTLDTLGMRQTSYFIVETKKEEEQFEQYDPKNITVKVNVWREGLTILTEQYLKPLKIGIREENTFEQFFNKVKKQSKISNPMIIKRNFSVGNPLIIYTPEENNDKTLISLRFFNGINLYIEPVASFSQSKWKKQFQEEKYRTIIKFNNPNISDDKNLQICIDNRKTLGQLKQKMSKMIEISPEEFRVKKSQNVLTEMVAFKKRLVDLKIINNQFLFVELGKSSKGNILIRKGTVSIVDDQLDFALGEEFQVQIQGVGSTVADLKNKIGEKYGIDCFNIRVREFKFHQFSEIFPDTESLHKIKERSLVWEEIQIEDPRGMQVYLRVFDAVNMQFGPLQSIFVEMTANYEELTMIIEEETQIQADKVLVWKSLSNYIEKSMMFECEWIETKFIPNPIRDQPLYISNDGQIFIVKAALEPYHPKPNKKYQSAREYESAVTGRARKGQASLKITVIEQKEDYQLEEEEEQRQQTEVPQQVKQEQK